jgi:glutamine amidotransferase
VIAVIDYKAGNLTSVMKALTYLHTDAVVTADPETVLRADKVVLPGVGHFRATQRLADAGLTEAVRESIAKGSLFLGICVGLQWLFEGSTEAPEAPGLGAFAGMCERFPSGIKSPHVGWNSLESLRDDSKLMANVSPGGFVYYTHSWRAPVVAGTAAETIYSTPFTAAVERDNVMGVQFHPEKSGSVGMTVLKNFVEL